MSTLESILSGERETAPVETTTTPTATPETNTEAQAPEPSLEDDLQADQDGKVSVKAVIAEREKGKRKYTEVVADVDRRIDEVNRSWEQRFNQLQTMLQPKQDQPAPAPAPEIWDDPNAFVRSQAMELVNPLQEQVKAIARSVAEFQYKDQPGLVEKAVNAFDEAARTRTIDPEMHRRIMASPNPFAAAVQWHQHTSTMSEIGSDPAAYKARLAEEIRAQVMAELQQGNAPQAATERPAPVMPSNFATGRNVGARSGPAYSGPPRLEDILGSRR
jgi:hypothetical protein